MSDFALMMEFLAKYGIFDIFFGCGGTALLFWVITRAFRYRNCSHLHVDAGVGKKMHIPGAGSDVPSMEIHLRNSGGQKIFVARAYFKEKKVFGFNWPAVRVHPAAYRIEDLDAYEIKFRCESTGLLTEYQCEIEPGREKMQKTLLPLNSNYLPGLRGRRKMGILFIQYATLEGVGIHRVRL